MYVERVGGNGVQASWRPATTWRRCGGEAGAAGPSSGACAITCSSRSSLMPALEAVRGSIAKLASLVPPTIGEDSSVGSGSSQSARLECEV